MKKKYESLTVLEPLMIIKSYLVFKNILLLSYTRFSYLSLNFKSVPFYLMLFVIFIMKFLEISMNK